MMLTISVAGSIEGQNVELQDLERLGRQAIKSGNFGEAIRSFRIVLERAENDAVSDTQLVVALGSLAEALRSIGEYDESERLFVRSLGILRSSNTANKQDMPVILTDLGRLYQETGRYTLAESFLKNALQLTERDLGPQHPQMVQVLNGLGAVYTSINKRKQAESSFKRAIAIAEKNLANDSSDLAAVLGNLAIF